MPRFAYSMEVELSKSSWTHDTTTSDPPYSRGDGSEHEEHTERHGKRPTFIYMVMGTKSPPPP
jgi:hypothetical protein